MKILEIAYVAYPVTDLGRARAFYEQTLGLKASHCFGEGEIGWIEYSIGAGTLAIGNGAPQWKPSPGGGSAGLEVEDFERAISHLRAAGCLFVVEPCQTPVCQLAVVSDPDGNSITIHKRKG